MPVTSVHPQYESHLLLWEKCRDTADGEEAVKAAGTAYLPMLEEQDDNDYAAYRMRALFYGGVDRTIRGLTGAVMRRDPEIQGWPEAKSEFLKTVGINGETFNQLATSSVSEDLTVGRLGLFLDAPENEEDGDPYLVIYFAENIINWKTQVVNGRVEPTMIVLREEVEIDGKDDAFQVSVEIQYRVLKLGLVVTEDGEVLGDGNSIYHQEIWKLDPEAKDKETEEFILDRTIVPKQIGGNFLNYIPFKFVNPESTKANVEKSPTLSLCNVNLSQYRTSADLEHGRHYTALPTAWAAGWDSKNAGLVLGSKKAWITDDPMAKVGFLEFSGAGLASLSEAIREKQALMATLGSRLLEEQKKTAEAAETVKLRHAGEQSVLSGVALSVSEGLTDALKWLAQWIGIKNTDGISVTLNTDYNVAGIDPQTLVALMAALQSGAMSFEVFYFNLQKGEMYPDGWSKEKEEDAIAAGTPLPDLPAGSRMGGTAVSTEEPVSPVKEKTGTDTVNGVDIS